LPPYEALRNSYNSVVLTLFRHYLPFTTTEIVMKKIDEIIQTLNTWHFICIGIIFSEIFTFAVNWLISLVWWRDISTDLFIIGTIDAFIVAFLVSGILIHFINKIKQTRVINEQLQKEIEARKKAEVALKNEHLQLVHAGRLAAIGEVATAMAHEINQPLSVINITIQGWELLKKRGHLKPEKMLTETEKLRKNIDRISTLIGNVQSMGSATHDISDVSIKNVIADVISICGMQFKKHGISLTIECPDELPPVVAVAMEIEQVLLNLLTNARYAAKEGKEFRKDCPPVVKIIVTNSGELIQIQVSDNGQGVPDKIKDKIFNPFFTTKPLGIGSGLGLSISNQIMQKFHGDLHLQQSSEDGATFIMQLPTKESAEVLQLK